ncbi:major facilitator superfamily transporter [Colletotrichum graminicola M1.001]|uniref:Major facilitator superfamily transporter n=1 Tax=Colletotrichum graminicola (strain M1.001 / M2 / FGSC 10212) TaxID=645133 RepID=E3QL31_COLGM|nr:major facilitator superfamily transporter [Colletotrichum graminicola M1.001]EFQ31569.1 major facilitator superfamily transporter [Colletotrichum graminicola M1.001]
MAEPKTESQYAGAGDPPVPASAPAPGPEPLSVPIGDAAAPVEPYSVFTRTEKWFIIGMVAVAGFYRHAPLPTNIYLPAIPRLSEAFGRSVDDIKPDPLMLWGPLSDRHGRRPVFLVCLAVLNGACVGIAVIPTDAFWLLIVLRRLQAAGCASAIALGAGVIGDISTPDERGGFFGMFNIGPMFSPCIAPAVGGALADKLGWRSIFWFQVIMAVCCLLFILLFLPETLRSLVGNGNVSPGGVPSINPFVILVYPDVAITLVFTGVVCAVNDTVVTTVASSFARVYPWLSETVLGLCYLPTGLGMVFGGTLTGKFLDWDDARIRRRVEAEGGEGGSVLFPKEYARLRTMPVLLVLFSGAVIAWGFCVDRGVHIAVPLVLQVVYKKLCSDGVCKS